MLAYHTLIQRFFFLRDISPKPPEKGSECYYLEFMRSMLLARMKIDLRLSLTSVP